MKITQLILAIFPVILFIIWIYLKDKYEKESIKDIIRFYVLGIVVSLLAIVIEELLIDINIFTGNINKIYLAFIVAALTEEGLKALVLIPILLKENIFNEKLDGIIYSVILSLGFASVENMVYIFLEVPELTYQVGLVRGLISIPAHVMFGITMGYYISKGKFSVEPSKKREYLIISILIPVLLHGIFDFILMIEYRWSIILFIVYIGTLYKSNLDKLEEYVGYSKLRFLRRMKKRKDD